MKTRKRKYSFLYKYWTALKLEYIRQRNERRFYSFLNKLPKRPEVITEELTYPQCEIVSSDNTQKLGITRKQKMKIVSMSYLPIRKTTRIIKVTQIPCKPLEFIPTELYRY